MKVLMNVLVLTVAIETSVYRSVDKQAHFLAGYGLSLSGALVAERMELPVPWLWGLVLSTGAAYVKERSDRVFDVRDFQATVWGGAVGSAFHVVIHL
jgi:hypothetical protein